MSVFFKKFYFRSFVYFFYLVFLVFIFIIFFVNYGLGSDLDADNILKFYNFSISLSEINFYDDNEWLEFFVNGSINLSLVKIKDNYQLDDIVCCFEECVFFVENSFFLIFAKDKVIDILSNNITSLSDQIDLINYKFFCVDDSLIGNSLGNIKDKIEFIYNNITLINFSYDFENFNIKFDKEKSLSFIDDKFFLCNKTPFFSNIFNENCVFLNSSFYNYYVFNYALNDTLLDTIYNFSNTDNNTINFTIEFINMTNTSNSSFLNNFVNNSILANQTNINQTNINFLFEEIQNSTLSNLDNINYSENITNIAIFNDSLIEESIEVNITDDSINEKRIESNSNINETNFQTISKKNSQNNNLYNTITTDKPLTNDLSSNKDNIKKEKINQYSFFNLSFSSKQKSYFSAILEINNLENKTHLYKIHFYAYNNTKRYSNESIYEILLKPKKSKKILLENKLNKNVDGTIKIKVKIYRDDRKTPSYFIENVNIFYELDNFFDKSNNDLNWSNNKKIISENLTENLDFDYEIDFLNNYINTNLTEKYFNDISDEKIEKLLLDENFDEELNLVIDESGQYILLNKKRDLDNSYINSFESEVIQELENSNEKFQENNNSNNFNINSFSKITGNFLEIFNLSKIFFNLNKLNFLFLLILFCFVLGVYLFFKKI